MNKRRVFILADNGTKTEVFSLLDIKKGQRFELHPFDANDTIKETLVAVAHKDGYMLNGIETIEVRRPVPFFLSASPKDGYLSKEGEE